jgi:hypothetical protein
MPERQDFIQRLLEELGQFLAEVMKYRRAGSHDAALLTLLHAQERLFVRPVQEFMTRPVEEQVHLLVLGESDSNARDKCLAYATLLTEVGHTYQAKGQAAVAQGAYQVALHVVLLTTLRFPPGDQAELRARIAALLDQLPPDDLNADVKGLLRQVEGGA